MSIKKYLSLDRLTEYDALIKEEIAEADASVLADAKSYADTADATTLESAKTYVNDELQFAKDELNEALNAKANKQSVVLIDEAQELTDEQKAQARDNINAPNADDVMMMPYEWVVTAQGRRIAQGRVEIGTQLFTDLETANNLPVLYGTTYTPLEWLFQNAQLAFDDSSSIIYTTVASNIATAYNALKDAGCTSNALGLTYFYHCPTYVSKDDALGWQIYRIAYTPSSNQFVIYDGKDVSRYFSVNLADGSIVKNYTNKLDTTLTQAKKPADAAAVGTAITNLETSINNGLAAKADASHSHDDLYYTEIEVDTLIEGVNTSITNITNGSVVVKEAEHAASADSATTAENCTGNAATATKATQDGNGKVIANTYETKTDASAKLAEAKSYADTAASTAANTVKNDLLNGAGGAYDTLKELGDLIDENTDAIDALEIVAAGKADKEHNHNDVYYTIEQIDAMEFITIDDIDAICGSSIVNANEVIF